MIVNNGYASCISNITCNQKQKQNKKPLPNSVK